MLELSNKLHVSHVPMHAVPAPITVVPPDESHHPPGSPDEENLRENKPQYTSRAHGGLARLRGSRLFNGHLKLTA